MLKATPVLGRPADKCNLIVRELRQEILRGDLAPGSQIPTRAEIEKRFLASTVTVQSALARLRADGFVHVRGRRGTFVASAPPHLYRYALAFPTTSANNRSWVRFWTALQNEALALKESGQRDISIYEGVSPQGGGVGHELLLADILAHRLAGVVFASAPHGLLGTPLLDEPGMPRVAIMSPGPHLAVPQVSTDAHSFFLKALHYLQNRGHRKVAFIVPVGHDTLLAQLLPQLSTLGLTTREIWMQAINLGSAYTAHGVVRLLMDQGQKERPDALIISDDNLLEFATAGLLAAGIVVPRDLEVVAHCNFPYPTPSGVPVTRLGFDTRKVLAACLELIDLQRQGAHVPRCTVIEAEFEA